MLNSIQYLRALAAIAVVLSHLAVPASDYFSYRVSFADHLKRGQLGVDVFFVISGYIIFYMILAKKQRRSEFLVNRISRIVPPYWLVTLLLATVLLIAPDVFRQRHFSAVDLFASMTFAAWLRGAYPMLGVGWTLSYEILFYAVILLFYRHIGHLSSTDFFLMTAGIAVSSLAVLQYGEVCNPLFFLEFISGALVFLTMTGKMTSAEGLALLALILLVEVASDDHRVLVGTILGVSLVAACTHLERKWPFLFGSRTWRQLGDASYSIYLLQVMAIPAAARLLRQIGGTGEQFLIAAPFAVVVVGWMFHQLIERHLFVATKRLLRPH